MLKSQLKTPALLVDMDAMEANLKRMAAFFAGGQTRLRPHYKNHKCVALAKRQLAHGAVGITCATLGEAEALARNGVSGILLANEIAGSVAIERYVALARTTEIILAIDNAHTVAALAAASTHARLPLHVLVDVDTGLGRCGVQPGEPALTLAQLATAQGLHVRGVMGYEGHAVRMEPGPAKVAAAHKAMESLVRSAELLRANGLPAPIVSGGGTGTYDISGAFPGVTEIQGGSYLLWDTDYATVCPTFEPALSLLGTVISRTANERLILDVGLKEVSGERGVPVLKNAEGAHLRKLNAEHAIVDILDPAFPAQVGDQLEIWARYSDATVNLHKQMYGIRNGRVEEIFLIED